MDENLTEPIHCYKCKKKTKNINAEKVQTENGRWRIAAQCSNCKTNKSKFIKAPEKDLNVKPFVENKLNDEDKLLLAQELHKPVRSKFERRRIVTKGIDDLWAADLVDMRKYSDENNGYNYLLNVIDTFSKMVWALPLKKKDGSSVTKAFEQIIERAKSDKHTTPKLLHTDKGLEFENKTFKNLLKEYDIEMYHTHNEEKSSIIERFNRTLNSKMKIKFEVRNNKKWIDILDSLIKEYNFKDIHRSIGTTPSEVNKSNEQIIFHKLFKTKNRPIKIKFQVGDRVRIKKFKKTFENKYQTNWSREIFVINEILNTQPVTYKIKDLDGEEIIGSFYNEELQKTLF